MAALRVGSPGPRPLPLQAHCLNGPSPEVRLQCTWENQGHQEEGRAAFPPCLSRGGEQGGAPCGPELQEGAGWAGTAGRAGPAPPRQPRSPGHCHLGKPLSPGQAPSNYQAQALENAQPWLCHLQPGSSLAGTGQGCGAQESGRALGPWLPPRLAVGAQGLAWDGLERKWEQTPRRWGGNWAGQGLPGASRVHAHGLHPTPSRQPRPRESLSQPSRRGHRSHPASG